MIHFLAVVGQPSTVERLFPRLLPALQETRVFTGNVVEQLGASRTWAVASIAAPDPGCAVRLVTGHDSVALLNGPALASGAGRQPHLTTDLLRAFETDGPDAVEAMLGGAYNFVGITPGRGLYAFVDFSGLYPLYFCQGDGFAVFSNRSTTAARVAGSSGWDQRALAWLIGHANLYGDRMPARGVSYLPPGRSAEVRWGGSNVALGRSPAWVWPAPSSDRGLDNLSSSEWDDVTDALVANFRALKAIDDRTALALTGGKDSRLCLALAKAAGLEATMPTYTTGAADSPEVQVAAVVAKMAGFEHRCREPLTHLPRDASGSRAIDPDAVWRRLRQHTYRYESTVCPWDGMNDHLRRTVLAVKGFGGELFRRGSAAQFRTKEARDVAEMAAMFENYQQRHDPLGLLPPDESRFQKQWLRDWVHDESEVVRFDLLPERFYQEYRLGHWNGPMGQNKAGRIDVNPLLSSRAVKSVLKLAPESRSNERLHFEVMRRAAPELVAIPFLKDLWADEIRSETPDLPDKPFPTVVKPTIRSLKSWQFPFLESQDENIRQLFRDASHQTEMGAICDLDKLVNMTYCTPKTGALHGRAVVSCISIALTLLGRTEPVDDEVLAE